MFILIKVHIFFSTDFYFLAISSEHHVQFSEYFSKNIQIVLGFIRYGYNVGHISIFTSYLTLEGEELLHYICRFKKKSFFKNILFCVVTFLYFLALSSWFPKVVIFGSVSFFFCFICCKVVRFNTACLFFCRRLVVHRLKLLIFDAVSAYILLP